MDNIENQIKLFLGEIHKDKEFERSLRNKHIALCNSFGRCTQKTFEEVKTLKHLDLIEALADFECFDFSAQRIMRRIKTSIEFYVSQSNVDLGCNCNKENVKSYKDIFDKQEQIVFEKYIENKYISLCVNFRRYNIENKEDFMVKALKIYIKTIEELAKIEEIKL